MIDHRQAAQLAATSLDFPLSADERMELAVHLRSCRECAAMDAALRADARLLRDLPDVDAPGEIRQALAWTAEQPARTASPGGRPLVLLAAALLVMIAAIGTAVAGALLFDRDAPSLLPDATPMSTAIPEASASPTATPTPAPSATPVATPDGPVVELVVGGWAVVDVGELNVRSEPGLDASLVQRLVAGAVMHVAEGPEQGDEGYAWFRVASLGGARGWIASGTSQTPFASVLTSDASLLHCGRVTSTVLRLDGGSLEVTDPIRIGDLALPAAAFRDNEIGAFELLRATRGEACVAARVGSDGTPSAEAEVSYYACGRPAIDGAFFRLRPAPGMDAVTEYQVKDTAVVHPAILEQSGVDDPMSMNLRAVMRWMALGHEDAAGCISHGIHISQGGGGGVELDGKQCTVIESVAADQVVLRASSSTELITLLLQPGSVDPALPIGVPTPVYIDAHDAINARQIGLQPTQFASCP